MLCSACERMIFSEKIIPNYVGTKSPPSNYVTINEDIFLPTEQYIIRSSSSTFSQTKEDSQTTYISLHGSPAVPSTYNFIIFLKILQSLPRSPHPGAFLGHTGPREGTVVFNQLFVHLVVHGEQIAVLVFPSVVRV